MNTMAVSNPWKCLVFGLVLTWVSAIAGHPVAAQYAEAPMLAARVAAGTLPPVAERLPDAPRVVTPFRSIGQYGGELRFPFIGENPGRDGLYFIGGWDWLVSWKHDLSGVEPNIAERWESNADATEFVFFLRPGLKWSDGAPFTADDVLFYIHAIVQDPEINPQGTAGWFPSDVTLTAEKIDDYAFRLTFSEPYGMLLYKLAQYDGRLLTYYPKHWLQQYHRAYNPDGVQALVDADETVSSWVELFNKHATAITTSFQNYFRQPERPVLFPWVITKPLADDGAIILERNPYYWKIDPDGNQLPYIDRIVGASFPNQDLLILAALGGNFDIVHNPRSEDHRLFDDTTAQSGLTIYYPIEDSSNVASIHFNTTLQDPVKAGIFAQKAFRIGMSHAIDRQAVIDILYNGEGRPWQIAPFQGSPLYLEQLATQYLEYDPDQAVSYLDQVFAGTDADGFYVDASGARFSLVLTAADQYGQPYARLADVLRGYWRAVGVDVVVNSVTIEAREALREANALEATIFTGEGGAGLTGLLDPRYYVPGFYWSLWANAYALHYNQPEAPGARAPDDLTRQRRDAYRGVMTAASEAEQIERMRAILRTAADEFYCMGIATPGPRYQPFSARMRNIPESWVQGWIVGVHKIILPEQWYFLE